MIIEEPEIKVGIIQGTSEVHGRFNGSFRIENTVHFDGYFSARMEEGHIVLAGSLENTVIRGREIRCIPLHDSTFTLFDVAIGIHFHWERKEEQQFRGCLKLIIDENETITAINEILLEDYLSSVISSEMSSKAPLEFLKAHAITSRSWLCAMLSHAQKGKDTNSQLIDPIPQQEEIIRWYDRVDHTLFDVCADDHCQRYQGITRSASGHAQDAVCATRGLFLLHNGEICDARYHKACGGLTENFENTWENMQVSYLNSVSDSSIPHNPIHTETEAEHWILSHPDAYCNTTDGDILRQVLPSFDQETTDFFRWRVAYTRDELGNIIHEKSGMDFGILQHLIPLERGPSGRIIRLKIVGSKKTITIGKELEIRRWLSRSHLYSSALIVSVERDTSDHPTRFILYGAGWGHGVGLCQIGAAVMATKGFSAEEILKHYFRGAEIQKLY
ncbi:MAG: SpoIID/LytB domain-containing protein [Syntrophaceae bacterium]